VCFLSEAFFLKKEENTRTQRYLYDLFVSVCEKKLRKKKEKEPSHKDFGLSRLFFFVFVLWPLHI